MAVPRARAFAWGQSPPSFETFAHDKALASAGKRVFVTKASSGMNRCCLCFLAAAHHTLLATTRMLRDLLW